MITPMMSRNWRDLIRPKAIQLDPDSNSGTYGKFTCEPLERGFGITVGNSLRRVLLASLQGAAITAVRMEGALHEFKVVLAGAMPRAPDTALIRRHYDRAVELSRGKSASIHLAYAEAVSVPLQNATEFDDLIQRALAVNPDDEPATRRKSPATGQLRWARRR